MNTIETMQKIQEVLAQAWSDESLKSKLLSNPKSVFAEYGLEFSSSMEVQVHEDTSNLLNYVLPQADEISAEVDLEEIEPVAGRVMKLALADEAFKTMLLTDPKSVIAEATGLALPMSLQIRVYADTPTVKHLVLPVNPASHELNDLELEAIAGGAEKSISTIYSTDSSGRETTERIASTPLSDGSVFEVRTSTVVTPQTVSVQLPTVDGIASSAAYQTKSIGVGHSVQIKKPS